MNAPLFDLHADVMLKLAHPFHATSFKRPAIHLSHDIVTFSRTIHIARAVSNRKLEQSS